MFHFLGRELTKGRPSSDNRKINGSEFRCRLESSSSSGSGSLLGWLLWPVLVLAPVPMREPGGGSSSSSSSSSGFDGLFRNSRSSSSSIHEAAGRLVLFPVPPFRDGYCVNKRPAYSATAAGKKIKVIAGTTGMANIESSKQGKLEAGPRKCKCCIICIYIVFAYALRAHTGAYRDDSALPSRLQLQHQKSLVYCDSTHHQGK